MEKRTCNYKYAMDNYWYCLHDEFATAVRFLELESGNSFVNFAAGGIPMEKYIPNDVYYFPIEINKQFAELYNYPLCKYDCLPFADQSIDKILVLASFHHAKEQDRINFYKESFRVLKNNGRLIICDVIDNSLQSKWLNHFVNQYNSLGHSGIFMSEKDIDLMIENRFYVTHHEVEYTWDFSSEDDTIDFFKHLFNLDLANDEIILNGIIHYFGNPLRIPWKLTYFILEKLSP